MPGIRLFPYPDSKETFSVPRCWVSALRSDPPPSCRSMTFRSADYGSIADSMRRCRMWSLPGGNSTVSIDDFVVGAKVRLLSETAHRPSIGLHFATRLPNAGNEKGIGLDTMDFFQSVLIGKTVSSTRFIGSLGLGILSDPTQGDRQNDVLTYGFSIIQAIKSFAVVFDANGRVSTRPSTPPPGTETRGTATFGFRYKKGAIRFDVGFYRALTRDDNRTGLTGGLTWTFKSFLHPSELKN